MDARWLMLIGIILLFAGILFIIISSFLSASKPESEAKVAVGGVIGFIPFGFGTDRKLVIITMVIAAAVLLIFVLLRYLAR